MRINGKIFSGEEFTARKLLKDYLWALKWFNNTCFCGSAAASWRQAIDGQHCRADTIARNADKIKATDANQ